MKYSIVIPTYNRPKTLLLTLESVAKQTLSPKEYEILVCDDGSKKDTARTVLEFVKSHPQNVVRYYYHSNGGPAKARNIGIKHARGEIIFFTDDDCMVPENWMEKLLDGYKKYPEAIGVGGWYRATDEILSKKYFQKYIDFIDLKYNPEYLNSEIKTDIFGLSLTGNTANMSYKKSALNAVSGFDENLTFPGTVDWELKKHLQSLGYSLVYIPLMVTHQKNLNLKNFIKKFFYQGRGRYYMTRKYPELTQDIKYNISFLNILKDFTLYSVDGGKYLFAHLTALFAGFFTQQYAKLFDNFIPARLGTNKKNTAELVIANKNGSFKTVVSLYKDTKEHMETSFVPVQINYSVVIPTFNRASSLKNTLESLISQSIPRFSYEIIVVDDGSGDNTKELVENFIQKYASPDIKYFYQSNAGPATARNRGIREAKGKIIFFTDDDCVVPKDWMETILKSFRSNLEVSAVGGWPVFSKKVIAENPLMRRLHQEIFERQNPFLYEIKSNNPGFAFNIFANNTANLAIKKPVLERMSGFNENFYWPGSEDLDLTLRILDAGFTMLYIPRHVMHNKNLDLRGFMKLHFTRGANDFIFQTINWELLNRYKKFNYYRKNLVAILDRLMSKPQKFYTLLNFLCYAAGAIYAGRKLAEKERGKLLSSKKYGVDS